MSPAEPSMLTAADQALIRLVAEGRTNEAITAILGVPMQTLKSRLKKLHGLLDSHGDRPGFDGVTARVRMTVWAYENGLMGVEWKAAHPPTPALPRRPGQHRLPARGADIVELPPPLAEELLELCRAIVADQPRGDLRTLAKRALRAAGGAR